MNHARTTASAWVFLLVLTVPSPDAEAFPAQSRTEQAEEALAGRFKDKIVTLREFNRSNEIKYEWNGARLSKLRPGDWTLYGLLQVHGVDVNRKRIRFKCWRIWARYDEKAEDWDYIRGPDTARVEIRLGESGLEGGWEAGLKAAFLTEAETLADIVPPHWEPFLRGTAPDPDEMREDIDQFKDEMEEEGLESPFRRKRGKRVEPLREARAARVDGTVIVLAYIGYDGRPEAPMILQPTGVGVEAALLKAIGTWVFTVPEDYELGGRTSLLIPMRVNYR